GLASVAAERVVALDGARNPALLRLAALALVAEGETARAEAYVRRLDQIAPTEAALLQPRLSQLIQTTALDQPIAAPVIDPTTVVQDSPSPDQISVDVAIILSQNTQREHTGMNLLDGLNLQYGYNRGVTRSLTRADGVPDGRSYQRVITDSISVPQLNYNLNLFNRGGQYYSVVARPQLTAYRGEESEFFVGRSLRVAVGGVNSSSLEQIDIGIDMRVTPLEITPKGTKVRIETGRSFLTADAAGTFNEALTTFRQKVAATAEIKFGETLLLSGLSESVDDKTYSKTPFLGSVPILRTFFNERNVTERRDSVLVLVTPSRPVTLAGQPWARAEHVRRLTEFWTTVVDPASNAALVQQRLSKMQLFTRMTKPDVKLPFLQSKNLATPSMLAELLPARTF
ncbi:MAG: secretion protein, partial [Pseudomonadota bacterium]|nr:secretion protein [Pseudomonadota bacterium]